MGEGEFLGKLRLPLGPDETQGYVLYPGFIDSCFQTCMATILNSEEQVIYSLWD